MALNFIRNSTAFMKIVQEGWLSPDMGGGPARKCTFISPKLGFLFLK